MFGVKSKVGHLWICYVVVRSVFCLWRNLGTTEKEHPSRTLPPPKVGEVLLYWWRAPVPLCCNLGALTFGGGEGVSKSLHSSLSDHRRGKRGEGCSFSAVPKFRRRPKPTIPLHSKFINDQLCFWHHTFSTKSNSTISSSILSTTRRGELYVFSRKIQNNVSLLVRYSISLWRHGMATCALPCRAKSRRGRVTISGWSTPLLSPTRDSFQGWIQNR